MRGYRLRMEHPALWQIPVLRNKEKFFLKKYLIRESSICATCKTGLRVPSAGAASCPLGLTPAGTGRRGGDPGKDE